jgi:hypothetical protein
MRISDLVLDESWDDATLATVIRLLAWMRQRWARERLGSAEACEAVISEHDAMRITNLRRPHVALQRLARLPLDAGLSSARASLETTQSASSVRLKWPKVAEYQGWDALDTGHGEPEQRPLRRPGSRLPAHVAQELLPAAVDADDPASLDRALRLLSKEPGSPESKRAWMERELPILLAESERAEPDNPRARSAHFRGLALRYWRQHQRAPTPVRRANGSGLAFDRPPTREEIKDALDREARRRGETL